MCKVEILVEGQAHVATVKQEKSGLFCSFSPPLRDKDGDFVFRSKIQSNSITLDSSRERTLRAVAIAAFLSLDMEKIVEVPEIKKLFLENGVKR
jgi:hypothetical protein